MARSSPLIRALADVADAYNEALYQKDTEWLERGVPAFRRLLLLVLGDERFFEELTQTMRGHLNTILVDLSLYDGKQ